MDDRIRTEDVWYAWRRGVEAIRGLSLDVPAAGFTAIVGPNGSGKSTLIALLAGVLRPDRGRVLVGDAEPSRLATRERARRIAYLPQSEPEDVPFTARELVLMGRFAYQGLLPFDRQADRDVADACLAEVGATDLADRRLAEMSGGERQRVHLARALAQEPEVLLLDEPASSLDLRHQAETYRLLSRLNREQGRGVVLVSHDLNLPGAFAENVVVIAEGRVAAVGTPQEILRAAVLEPVYRTRILEARLPGSERPVLVPATGDLPRGPSA